MKNTNDFKTEQEAVELNKLQSLAFKSLGIAVSFIIFGVLEERITRHTYGENHAKFVYYQSLVGILCFSYYLIAQSELIFTLIIMQNSLKSLFI